MSWLILPKLESGTTTTTVCQKWKSPAEAEEGGVAVAIFGWFTDRNMYMCGTKLALMMTGSCFQLQSLPFFT